MCDSSQTQLVYTNMQVKITTNWCSRKPNEEESSFTILRSCDISNDGAVKEYTWTTPYGTNPRGFAPFMEVRRKVKKKTLKALKYAVFRLMKESMASSLACHSGTWRCEIGG